MGGVYLVDANAVCADTESERKVVRQGGRPQTALIGARLTNLVEAIPPA